MAIRLREIIRNAKVYFRATEAVSKPIAFLMAFFGLSLAASALIGVFLLGRWGYRSVVRNPEPVVVTVPEAGPAESTPTVPSESSNNQSTAPAEQPKTQTNNVKTIPNTGTGATQYIAIVLVGALLYQIRMRKAAS